jgi:hypothetical protein
LVYAAPQVIPYHPEKEKIEFLGVLRTAGGCEPLHTEYFMFGIFFAPGITLNEVIFKTGLWKMQVDLFFFIWNFATQN